MKKYIILSLLFLSLLSCGDDEDIYKGDASGEYVSNVDWTEASNSSTGDFLKYFFCNDDPSAPGEHYFLAALKWHDPNKIESGSEPDERQFGFGYWMQPHAMDVLIDAYIRTGEQKYRDAFEPWLSGMKYWNGRNHWGNRYPDSEGLWNNFYDDMLWCALTTARMYDITGEQVFWDATMTQWKFIKTAKNEKAEDVAGYGNDLKATARKGLAWKWDSPYSRMSCSNGPGCLLAMKLYKICKKEGKDEEAAYYLNFAQEVYAWMSQFLCDISTGQVYDNMSVENSDPAQWKPDKVALSYNQGTFMASALELYNATGDEEYLRNAVAFGSYQVNKKMDSTYPIFSGEGSNGDNLLFRGVFLRYFLDMLKQPTNKIYTENTKKKFINALRSSSDVLWTFGHNPNRYFYQYHWAQAPTAGNRGTDGVCDIATNAQVPAATLIEIRARYEDWAKGKESEDRIY